MNSGNQTQAPLLLYSTSRVFNLGSNSAIKKNNGTALSDVELKFPNIHFKDKIVREIMLSITHAEIPNSFYLVNSSNNTLIVNSNIFTIPAGNYNAITFRSAISSFLTGLGITITYNTVTNKYAFSSATTFTLAAASTCTRFIGLGTSDITGTNITSPYVCNFLPIPRILFRSTAFNTSNYNGSDGSTDLLLSVQNSSTSGALILWNNYSQLKYDITHVDTINIVDIMVTDDAGNLIDFNNCDWYITFRIEYIYEVPQNAITSFTKAIKAGSIASAETINPLDMRSITTA